MIDKLLLDNGAIKFGDFTLTSGQKSSYYVDIKEVSTVPRLLNAIAQELSAKVQAGCIAGVELGAVPILIATAIKLDLPYLIIRKEREHGVKNLVVGRSDGVTKADIIEDVVTTGGSVLKAATLLRSRGIEVSRVIAVVDREQGGEKLLGDSGIELVPLVRISDILKGREAKA